MKNTVNFLLFLTLWLLFGSAHSQSDTTVRKLSRAYKLPTTGIICFGDSITYGLNVAGAGTTEGIHTRLNWPNC